MTDLTDAVAVDDDEAIDESRIIDRTTRRLALLPMPEGLEGEIEVVYQTTIARQKLGTIPPKGPGSKVSCAICVTVTDANGTKSTSCRPFPCPKSSAA
jgi:hypothetical protein